jgi:TonB family protein
VTIRRAQTFSISSDGGVQVLPFLGTGGLDKADILAVIKSHQDEVKHCYEVRLQSQPRLAGRLTMAWLIGSEGEVAQASIAVDSFADPLVGRCVLESVRTWRFLPPINGGTVNVTFPYIFVSKEEHDEQVAPAPQQPSQRDELIPSVPQRQGPQPSAN